jgi:hypothetical protein
MVLNSRPYCMPCARSVRWYVDRLLEREAKIAPEATDMQRLRVAV